MKRANNARGCGRESALKAAGVGLVFLLSALVTPATAQVISVNMQGYVNKTIPLVRPITFAYIANPLNTIDNRLSSIFPNLPNGTMIYTFRGNTFEVYTYFDRWLPNDTTLYPGEGVILALDRSTAPDPMVLTFVGEVPMGTLANPIPPGVSLKASACPRHGFISQDLALIPRDGDMLNLFDEIAQTDEDPYSYIEPIWFEFEPVVRVGHSFWYYNASPTVNSWLQSCLPFPFARSDAATGIVSPSGVNRSESTHCLVGPVSVSAGRATSSRMEISWPVEFSGFQLEETASLTGVWSNVTQTAEIVQNRHLVTVTNSSGVRFFRIIRAAPTVLVPPLLYSKLCDPSTLTLFWDRSFTGFVLESTDNLGSGAWATIGPGINTNGFWQSTVSPGVSLQFYRLRK